MAAAPKKKAKTEVESVQPQTWTEKANDTLADLLADAAKARTCSIKLNSVEYASELSKQLLDHASAMEKHYGKVRHALDKKEPDNVLKPLLKQADDISAFVAKAQALIGGLIGFAWI